MKEIISKIFYDYNFEERKLPLVSNSDIFFAVNLDKNCLNFYLVVFTDKIDPDFLEVQVSKYYNAIKGLESGYDERMDKNLSLLVCLQNDNVPKEELLKKVFEIEEDPYHFKKYVFSYSEEQYKVLSKYFLDNYINHSSILLNNVVNNIELFSSFKKQPDNPSNSLFNLCSKLFIKIPFITFERGEEKIENLSAKIKEELQEKELLEYSNKWLEIKEENGSYNIHDILAVIIGGEKNEL